MIALIAIFLLQMVEPVKAQVDYGCVFIAMFIFVFCGSLFLMNENVHFSTHHESSDFRLSSPDTRRGLMF